MSVEQLIPLVYHVDGVVVCLLRAILIAWRSSTVFSTKISLPRWALRACERRKARRKKGGRPLADDAGKYAARLQGGALSACASPSYLLRTPISFPSSTRAALSTATACAGACHGLSGSSTLDSVGSVVRAGKHQLLAHPLAPCAQPPVPITSAFSCLGDAAKAYAAPTHRKTPRVPSAFPLQKRRTHRRRKKERGKGGTPAAQWRAANASPPPYPPYYLMRCARYQPHCRYAHAHRRLPFSPHARRRHRRHAALRAWFAPGEHGRARHARDAAEAAPCCCCAPAQELPPPADQSPPPLYITRYFPILLLPPNPIVLPLQYLNATLTGG